MCGANEDGCRSVTVCNQTIYCRLSSACQDPNEPNNPAAAAPNLQTSCRTMGSLCEGDSDWFRIDVEAGEVFSVSAHFFHSQGDVDLTLFVDQNNDGAVERQERIDRSWNTGDCESVTNASDTSATTYWLEVSGAEATTTQDEFRLVWGVSCVDAEPQQPFCQ